MEPADTTMEFTVDIKGYVLTFRRQVEYECDYYISIAPCALTCDKLYEATSVLGYHELIEVKELIEAHMDDVTIVKSCFAVTVEIPAPGSYGGRIRIDMEPKIMECKAPLPTPFCEGCYHKSHYIAKQLYRNLCEILPRGSVYIDSATRMSHQQYIDEFVDEIMDLNRDHAFLSDDAMSFYRGLTPSTYLPIMW